MSIYLWVCVFVSMFARVYARGIVLGGLVVCGCVFVSVFDGEYVCWCLWAYVFIGVGFLAGGYL